MTPGKSTLDYRRRLIFGILGRDLATDHKICDSPRAKTSQRHRERSIFACSSLCITTLQFTIDRTKAAGVGLTERGVAGSLLLSLGGSGQTAPSYWVDQTTGVQYLVSVRAPECESRHLITTKPFR